MSRIVIADSTCLIGLSKIGKLEILHQLFEEIVIPHAVYHEVVNLGAGRSGAEEVKHATWIKVQHVQNELAVQTLRLTLGHGESEAIILASETKADFIILDDWRARKTATSLSLNVVGTVGVLARAEQKKLISSLSDILEELRKVGFRLPKT
ncbi:MAG: hypothetical protein B6242_10030 [Anaerolineaceae bacterium 4572_78]|nr:MAG: hypothetical protein B6242_10030 [Anaerolineaceae bacterium 4572_78]